MSMSQEYLTQQDCQNIMAGERAEARRDSTRLALARRLESCTRLSNGLWMNIGLCAGHEWEEIVSTLRFASLYERKANVHDALVKALEDARRDMLALRLKSDTGSLRGRQIEASAARIAAALEAARLS